MNLQYSMYIIVVRTNRICRSNRQPCDWADGTYRHQSPAQSHKINMRQGTEGPTASGRIQSTKNSTEYTL